MEECTEEVERVKVVFREHFTPFLFVSLMIDELVFQNLGVYAQRIFFLLKSVIFIFAHSVHLKI